MKRLILPATWPKPMESWKTDLPAGPMSNLPTKDAGSTGSRRETARCRHTAQLLLHLLSETRHTHPRYSRHSHGPLLIPVIKDWHLNERHYGALQGLNKAETAKSAVTNRYTSAAAVLTWHPHRSTSRTHAIPATTHATTGWYTLRNCRLPNRLPTP